jgi:hypothetical protein
MSRLAVEAIVVGILTVLVGVIVKAIISMIVPSVVPDVCKGWNKYHIMELSLFCTGVLVHLGCEFSGLN